MSMTLTPPKEITRSPARTRRLPIEPKVALTAFTAVLVPIYLFAPDYGLRNFLYVCDIALLITVVGLWLENRLLLSMQLVGILTIQTIWSLDYFGHYLLGYCPFGVSQYAFNCHWLLHVLTLFHVWLPLLLLWAVRKLGYDRRAYVLQCGVMFILGVIAVYFTDPKYDVNFNASFMSFTMDGALAGRLPASLNFIYQGFHAWTEWRLSLPPVWAQFVNFVVSNLMMWFGILLPAHLVLVKFFEKRSRNPQLVSQTVRPSGFAARIGRLFWMRPVTVAKKS